MAPVLDLDNARLVLSSSGTCCYRLRLKCVPTCYSSTTAWSEQTRVIGPSLLSALFPMRFTTLATNKRFATIITTVLD